MRSVWWMSISPEQEFVITLLKAENHASSYRIRLVSPDRYKRNGRYP